jgi:hypothetical protein
VHAARGTGPAAPTVGVLAARYAAFVLAALAASYVLAVGAWLWSLRDGISGPDVSSGVMLIGIAIVLAWLTGVAGAGSGGAARHGRGRTWVELGVAVARSKDDPLAILRLGLAVQATGCAVLVLLR